MRSNGLLKWLMIPIVLVLVFVGIKLYSHHSAAPIPVESPQLTHEEMKSLGIGGDTPHDTVATLVAQVKQLRSELKSALQDNAQAKAENDRLRARESNIDQRIQAALANDHDLAHQDHEHAAQESQRTQTALQDLQRRLDAALTDKADPNHVELPVGLGLENGDGEHFGERLRWVEPQDVLPGSKSNSSPPATSTGAFQLPSLDASAEATLTPMPIGPETQASSDSSSTQPVHAASAVKRVYTLPSDSTLMGSISMTALIGRVPVDGTVTDPYPFKVLIGSDNLTANGIELPDVAGAVVSGSASGDWTLSCVRGRIQSVTFVFRDGTIRTAKAAGLSGSSEGLDAHGGMGWISDPYGVPCVSGERRSNAAQYLGSQMLITAAGAGAASLIKNQNDSASFVSSNGNTLGTVGISGNEAMGRILAGGVQDMSNWVNKLYGQAFAAVYVRPGAAVAIHLEQPLEIDYNRDGRKVREANGDDHVPTLD